MLKHILVSNLSIGRGQCSVVRVYESLEQLFKEGPCGPNSLIWDLSLGRTGAMRRVISGMHRFQAAESAGFDKARSRKGVPMSFRCESKTLLTDPLIMTI